MYQSINKALIAARGAASCGRSAGGFNFHSINHSFNQPMRVDLGVGRVGRCVPLRSVCHPAMPAVQASAAECGAGALFAAPPETATAHPKLSVLDALAPRPTYPAPCPLSQAHSPLPRRPHQPPRAATHLKPRVMVSLLMEEVRLISLPLSTHFWM